MNADMKNRIRDACQLLLSPVASVVLKCGMTWKEFADLSKAVFVDVATEEFGIKGRPTNISRMSILTGISRKEVKRQRELLDAKTPETPSKTTDATRVLSGWHQDPEYLNGGRQPIPLPETGPEPSFTGLFARYGGDTPLQTMLKELLNTNSIQTDAAGRLVVKTRYYMPTVMSEGHIQFFGSNLFDHAQTLNANLAATADGGRRFEGFAVDDRVDPDAANDFKTFVDRRGQQFLEEVDDWLEKHRTDSSNKSTTPIRLGVGLYAIHGPLPRGKS